MDWHEYFFNLARAASLKSKDPSTKVGCIIVGPNNEVRTLGFNGFARNVNDDIPERWVRPLKYQWIEHAERNAIYNAARCGIPLDGCKIYLDWCPCNDCARAIIQAGIKEVFIDGDSESFNNKELQERWKQQIDISQDMFKEAGVLFNIHYRSIYAANNPN